MLRKKFYKTLLFSIVVEIFALLLIAGIAWVNYPRDFDKGIKTTIKVKDIYTASGRSSKRYVYSDTMKFKYPESIKFKENDTIDIIYILDDFEYLIIDARNEDTVFLSKDKLAKDLKGGCIGFTLIGLLLDSLFVLWAITITRKRWSDYHYCHIQIKKIEIIKSINDYDYVVEKEIIKPNVELQQEFAEKLSEIEYTFKKIQRESGHDKFILVFYNKDSYDVIGERYVDFKIYDSDYSLANYRIITEKKKFRFLVKEWLGMGSINI